MPGGGKLKGVIDATGTFRTQQLKRGPDLYEQAMEAAYAGDAKTALELLEELRLLLQLDEEDFSKMLGQAHSGPPEPPLEMQEGGPPDRPRGKGALLRAAELFARRAGKVKSPGVDIPPGYDSFYTRNTGDGVEIWGVTPEGRETRVNRFPAGMMGNDLETTQRFADQLASIYNTGGFSDEPVVPVSLDEIFPPPPPEPPRADVIPIGGRELAPEGNRYRSFQEHLENLKRAMDERTDELSSDPSDLDWQVELADLAYQAENALEPLEYEALLDDIYDAGLTPSFYRTFAEEQAIGPMPPEGYPRAESDLGYDPETGDIPGGPRALGEVLREMGIQGDMPEEDLRRILSELDERGVTLQVDPVGSLDDMLGRIATTVEDMGPGEVDLNEMLDMLRGATEGLENDPYLGRVAREVQALTPEQLQADLERILRERGKTPIDLRRLSFEELSVLQERGEIPSDLADALMDDMVDLEAEFQDIIYDITGDYPDELRIMPDLELPETYVIESYSMDTGTRRYHQFDPEQGPREATREQIDSFNTQRPEALGPTPEAPTGPQLGGRAFPDEGHIHDEISNTLDNLLAGDYEEQMYIDEWNLHPDPNNPGAWYATDVVTREVDTNELLDDYRHFYIDKDGEFEEIVDTRDLPENIRLAEPPRRIPWGGGRENRHVSEGKYDTIKEHIDRYAGIDGEYEIYPDRNRPGMYAVRERSMHSSTRPEGMLIDLTAEKPWDSIEEVEFRDWPPSPRGFQEGGKVDKRDLLLRPEDMIEGEMRDLLLRPEDRESGSLEQLREAAEDDGVTAKQFMRNVARSLFGAIPGIGSHPEGQAIAGDVGEHMYNVGALPIAGFKSQWWGINPSTGEFEYAGPGADTIHGRARPPYPEEMLLGIDPEEYYAQYRAWRDWEDPGLTGPIPGIIDETALLPAMPQMVEMMVDMDELADPDYEPTIGAPEWSLEAAERAEANWDAAIQSMDIDEPEGFIENTLMAGGMMLGQIPLPTSMLSRLKSIPRFFMTKGARAAHILDDIMREAPDAGTRLGRWAQAAAGSGPEFLFPTIDPSAANYMAGALFGGTLMTALTPDEEELLRMQMPTQHMELIEIMQDESQPQEHRDMARRILREIVAKMTYDLMEAGTPTEQTKEAMQRYSQSPEFQQAMEFLTQGGPMAGGGRVKKGVSRRDVLKGLLGAGAGALAAGKAGVREGVDDPAAALRQIEEALETAPATVARGTRGTTTGTPFRQVVEHLREEMRYWIDENPDPEMVEMYESDMADYEYVARAMDEGRHDDAIRRYDHMDTAAREAIYDAGDDITFSARRQLGRAGSDWDSLDWDDLDIGEQEMILDDLEAAYEEGGLELFNERASAVQSDWGVEFDEREAADFFDFLDETDID